MRVENSHDRVVLRLRAQFWDSLPTKAYRVRQLIRRWRGEQLDLGELEELELTVRRLADTASALDFAEVAVVTSRLAQLIERQHGGEEVWPSVERHCAQLDQIIDDMTLEALATGLRSLWDG